jgi:hypothetical protein
MIDARPTIEAPPGVSNRRRVGTLLLFCVSVSLLAGYVAITLGYPSLYNVEPGFAEYALPWPFCWGMLHIPSMFLYGVPLALLPEMRSKHVAWFRAFCAVSFVLLLLELDRKIPILLFPKIDALLALLFSLVVCPPNRKDSPALVASIKMGAALALGVLGWFAWSAWTHRTPALDTTSYGDGIFELTSIALDHDYPKRMTFEVDLLKPVPEGRLCTQAQELAAGLRADYPFDEAWRKELSVSFHPESGESGNEAYPLGMLAVNERDRETGGRFPCYLKYRTNP